MQWFINIWCFANGFQIVVNISNQSLPLLFTRVQWNEFIDPDMYLSRGST